MAIRSVSVSVVSSFLLLGCAQTSQWSPTVDTYGDPRAQYLSQDEAECKALAERAAGSTAQQTGEGALFGGLLGAAAGAAIGAAVGSAGTGAAIGAATGGFGGGAYKGMSSNEEYKSAYVNCMRRRGHNVIE